MILPDAGRTTPVILSITLSHRSTDQLEQLIGKQGYEAKHEMKPDFRSPTHHPLAAPKPSFSRLLKRSATVRSR